MAEKRKLTDATTSSKKRRVITLEEKMNIIQRAEKGESAIEISRSVSMPRTTIATIIKDKQRIKDTVKSAGSLKSSIITKQRTGLITEMEKLLVIWITNQTKRNSPICLKAIQEKASSLHTDLKNKAGSIAQDQTFSASRGWFNRFKARHNFHNLKTTGEAASADHVAANAFPDFLKNIIEDGGYSPQQIFNVDETGLYWKKMPNRTYISREEKSMPGFKAAKDRLTLLFGANASGDFKLKPLLIYHSENPRALKGYSKSHLPIIWKSNPKAWVTGNVFEDWFSHHFVPAVESYCLKNNLSSKALLILDNAPGHPQTLDDLNSNIKVVFLPPNTTALIQPMDQGVIASFKAYYLRRTFDQAIKATDGEDALTLKEFWKGYNIYQAIKNIGESWAEVTAKNLHGVWKRLCPQYFIDSSVADSIDEDVAAAKESVLDMGHQLGLDEIENEDIDELLESHDVELTNEDLIELADQNKAESENSDDNDEQPARKVLTTKILSESFKLFEAGMRLLEENDPNTERSSKVSRELSYAYQCYQEIYAEKKKASLQLSLDKFLIKPSTS